MSAKSLLVMAAVAALAVPARAQRREGGDSAAVFQVVLPVSARFGEHLVTARHYRLTLVSGGFALSDVDSLVLVDTLPVVEASAEPVDKPGVEVQHKGQSINIVLRNADRIYRASGVVAQATAAANTLVTLANKEETTLDRGTPAEQSARAVVEAALPRFLPSIAHCVDLAQRSRWGTDDPRFVKCACPIVSGWKLPHTKETVRVHQVLAVGKSGVSLTATPKGKATACRVWVGLQSPEELPAKPTTASGAVPPVAPPVATPPPSHAVAPTDAPLPVSP